MPGEKTEIRMGEYKVARDVILTGTGIGSCLLICLYEPKSKVGGMAHAMLPLHGEQKQSAKYADSAIDIMLSEMEKNGANRKKVEARLVGGAKMFQTQTNDSALAIGAKNVKNAKEKLEKEGIPLIGEDTGGTHGRSAEFDLSNGVITIKTVL